MTLALIYLSIFFRNGLPLVFDYIHNSSELAEQALVGDHSHSQILLAFIV